MSERFQTEGRWFRIFFLTVECFSLILVLTYWILPFTGSIWGTKFRYHYLFDGSAPVMVVLLVCALLTWRQHRRHALVQFGVLVAWAVLGGNSQIVGIPCRTKSYRPAAWLP